MEPAPLVLQEAAFNNLPSIVADHGGMTEFIKDGINGLYFKAGDIESLKDAMNLLITNPLLSKKLGDEASRITKEDKFGVRNHLNNLEKFYDKILYQAPLIQNQTV